MERERQDNSPLREQIGDVLRQHILEGKFGQGGRLPSVRKLATEYNLSKSTVANAIASLKQQGLLRTTQKQGVYTCSGTTPQQVQKKRTGRIGVFAHGNGDVLRERIYFDAFYGMRTAASSRGYTVLYLGSEVSDDTSSEMPFGIRDIDGLVYLVSMSVSKKFVAEVIKREIPLVMLDSRDTRFNIDSVLVDNIEGTKLAMRHLIGLGHRRIALLNSSTGQSAPERLEGYREALREAGVPFDPRLVKQGSSKISDGRSMMRELLPLQPTAVFAFSDYLGLGAITAAEDAGLSIPGDLSVASFGNEAQGYGECVGHALTTVDVDMRGMGAAAVELLMKRMAGSTEPSEAMRVKSNLLIGTTTAKPRSS